MTGETPGSREPEVPDSSKSPVHQRGSEGNVRVVQVTRSGSSAGWSSLQAAVSRLSPAGFISVDTEFSGLGNDSRLNDPDLTVRYDALREVVNSRAVVSLGVCVFAPSQAARHLAEAESNPAAKSGDGERYDVSAYDFTMCCETPWSIAPESGRFLVAHGFDFNRLFESGIPYIRASTERTETVAKASSEEKKPATSGALPASTPPRADEGKPAPTFGTGSTWGPFPRGLLWRLGRAGVPLVIHNGLLDLVFLFAAFHGPLPNTLSLFVSALLDAVPAGFVDTKHLAGKIFPQRPNFLSYVYAQCVQERRVFVDIAKGLPRPEIASPEDFRASLVQTPTNAEPVVAAAALEDVGSKQKAKVTLSVCMLYSVRGFCPKGTRCKLPHDPFRVLELEKCGKLPEIQEARKIYKVQCNLVTSRLKLALTRKRASGDTMDDNATIGSPSGSKRQKLNKKQRKKLLGLLDATSITGNGLKDGEAAIANANATAEAANGIEGCEAKARDPTKSDSPVAGSDVCEAQSSSAVHSAGWDAYMTGFIFAVLRSGTSRVTVSQEHNKLALSKKTGRPLLLCRSSFEELNLKPAEATEAVVKNAVDPS